MPDHSPDLQRARETLATTGDPLVVPDGAGGAGLPAAGSGPAARYRLGEEIARGGMGVVLRATDTVLGREVAVKLLQGKYAADAGTALRFVAEARITGQLQHPGIPAIHDLGILPDGRPFLAMKLIKGETLDQLLRRRGDAAAGRGGVVAVFEQVCQAVAYAHAHGVVHRDLKPANIMVGAFGEVQVMDWGLAKVLAPGRAAADGAAGDPLLTRPYTEVRPLLGGDLLTHAGSVLGTPAYMPPEQAIGAVEQIDARSDVFGLGGVLAAVLTGRPPFVGDSAEHSRQLAARGKVHDCFGRLDGCGADPELVALCKRCLSPEKADRPAHAGEVAAAVAALRAAADERARHAELDRVRVEGEQAAAEAQVAEQRKRRRILLVASGIIAGTLLAGLAGSVWEMRRAVQAEAQATQAEARAENRSAELTDVNRSLRQEKYVADMNLAQHAWEENNLVRTRQLLDQHRPKPGEDDLRGFEWHYLQRMFHGARWVAQAYPGPVFCVAYTPDSKQLISCGSTRPALTGTHSGDRPGEVKVWDAATGRQLALNLQGLTERVCRIALSSDGKYLAAGCGRAGVRIWELATGQPIILEVPAGEIVSDVGFSPDGTRLVSRSVRDGGSPYLGEAPSVLRVWDLSSRKSVVNLDSIQAGYHGPAFSPDGKYLAVASFLGQSVRVLDASNGREVFSCNFGRSYVTDAVFSPDGKSLAACGGQDPVIWDVATRQKRLSCPSSARFGAGLAYSPDGKRLAMASLEGVLELWDAGTGQKLETFKGHRGQVRMVAFSPDGAFLASSGDDGTLRVWDIAGSGDAIPVLKDASHPGYIELSPDGRTVLVELLDQKCFRLMDAATGRLRGGPIPFEQSNEQGSDWTADSSRLIVPGVAADTVSIYDAATGGLAHTLRLDRRADCVALSPDGRLCAYSGPSGTAAVLDTKTGTMRVGIKGSADRIIRLTFSPDGTRLASVDLHGQLQVWDVATGRATTSALVPDVNVSRVRFSPDGRQLAFLGNHTGLAHGEVRLLDAVSGRELLQLQGHSLHVTDLAFSPDGRRLATASSDRTVRVWDRATGQEVLRLRGHTLDVASVRFVSGGNRLISVSADQTVRHWDATPLPD